MNRNKKKNRAGVALGNAAKFIGKSAAGANEALKQRARVHGIPVKEMAEECLPGNLRYFGRKAVDCFIQNKDVSHIRSRKFNPREACDASNCIFENASANRSRGSADMTRMESVKAKSVNAGDCLISPAVLQQALRMAVRAAGIAAVSVIVIESLKHRSVLIDGSKEERRRCMKKIARLAGVSAVVAVPLVTILAALHTTPATTFLMPMEFGMAFFYGGQTLAEIVEASPTEFEKRLWEIVKGAKA